MKHLGWIGWLVAALTLMLNATYAVAGAASGDPLEGRLLQHTGGAVYVYQGGVKFQLQLAEVGDRMIDAIPSASVVQWEGLFTGQSGSRPPAPATLPQPFPGYS
jgi:hypothetical protein